MAFDPKTYGSQLLGLDRTRHIVKRLADAMHDPKKYFKDRQVQMDSLIKEAQDSFSKNYDAIKKLGLSNGQSKQKAEDITNKIMEVLYDEFNAEWPSNISDLAVNKLMKQASAKVENEL